MAMIKCPECGTDVSDTAAACPKCGYGVKQHIENEIRAAQEAERREVRKARAEERNKKLKVIIPIVSVVAVVAIIASWYCYSMSQRMTFKTEDEMREYLKGDWEEETKEWQGDKLCRIKDDVLELIDTDLYSNNSAGPIEYFPEKGYIKVTDVVDNVEKYVIKKGGVLKAHYRDFKKCPEGKHRNIDSFVDAIGFSGGGSAKLSDGGMLTVEGKVANEGNRGYNLMKLRVDVLNGDDVVESFTGLAKLDNGDYEIYAGKTMGYTINGYIGDKEYDSVSVTRIGYRGADDK